MRFLALAVALGCGLSSAADAGSPSGLPEPKLTVTAPWSVRELESSVRFSVYGAGVVVPPYRTEVRLNDTPVTAFVTLEEQMESLVDRDRDGVVESFDCSYTLHWNAIDPSPGDVLTFMDPSSVSYRFQHYRIDLSPVAPVAGSRLQTVIEIFTPDGSSSATAIGVAIGAGGDGGVLNSDAGNGKAVANGDGRIALGGTALGLGGNTALSSTGTERRSGIGAAWAGSSYGTINGDRLTGGGAYTLVGGRTGTGHLDC